MPKPSTLIFFSIFSIFSICSIFSSSLTLNAQSVVVSEYMCQSGGLQFVEKEWTELLVIDDNVSLVGYVVTDYDGTVSNRSGGPQFLDIPLWRHLRAGTIILIRHGSTNEVADFDTSAADGYIEVSQTDLRFFRIFGTSLGMNIAQDLDYVEIVNPDTVHVHGLAHCRSTSPGYAASGNPKVAYDTNNLGDASSVRVTGRTLAAYGAGVGKDSVSRGRNLGIATQAPSPGLPNLIDNLHAQAGVKNVNQFFWREIREPEWSATPQITVVDQQANKHVIQWTPLNDPFPDDRTTGYIVLRDTLGFAQFQNGVIRDGAVINVGQKIGTSTVVAIINTKDGNTFTDQNNLLCGMNYMYRVYGYRFNADDVMPAANTHDSTARGRQFNGAFAQSVNITKANPSKPVISASRTTICPGDTTTLSTTTTNADQYVWMVDGRPVPVGGTTTIVVREAGIYTLKIIAAGGCSAESDPVSVSFLPAPSVMISPTGTHSICSGDTITITSQQTANSYQWLRDGLLIPGATSASYKATTPGDYQLRIASQQGCPGISAVMRLKFLDVRFHFSSTTIDFDTLGQCATSASRTVTIVNDGAEAITVSNISMPAGFALASPAPGFVVPVGGSQVIRLLFSPTTLGTTTGNASFTAKPCNVQQTISLRGHRTEGLASINIAGIDFGVRAACPNSNIRVDTAFYVSNDGVSNVLVKSPLVPAPFFLNFRDTILLPGESARILVQYRPLNQFLDMGVSQVIEFPYESSSCKDTLRASLQAGCYRPRLTSSISTLDVGLAISCASFIDTTIDVTNPTAVPVTLTGTAAGRIQILDAPVNFEPSTAKSVRVRVSPSGTGPFTISDSIVGATCTIGFPLTLEGNSVDPVYSVVAPTMDFGTLNFCDPNAKSELNQTINAKGIGGLRSVISYIKVSAPFSTNLVVGNTVLDSRDFVVTYAPTLVGSDVDTVIIVLGPCNDTLKFVVRGSAESGSRTTSITSTDFGVLAPAQSAYRDLTVSNVNAGSLVVERLEGITPPFRIEATTRPLPATLTEGESVRITIAYDYAGPDRFDTIRVVSRTTGTCSDSVAYTLTGSTESSDTSLIPVTLDVPEYLVARVGDIIDVPVSLLTPSPIASLGITFAEVFITYDATLMLPTSVFSSVYGITGTTQEVSPGRSKVSITSTQPIDAGDPLFMLKTKVYLGAVSETPIIVDSVKIMGLDVAPRNGKLTVTGDCAIETQTIALGLTPQIVMHKVGTDEIELQLQTLTDDATTLAISDALGNRHSIFELHVRPGITTLIVPTSPLPAGSYYVSMAHGRFFRTLSFIVVR